MNSGRKRSGPIIALSLLMACCGSGWALDPSLHISQYAHTAWTFRDGFPVGNIFAIAQTTDGYFWLGGEFGLFRFDGVRATPWQPPPGQQLPDRFVFRLLGARDGTLWIGTFSGLLTWDGLKLIRHPEFDGRQVESLFEDHEGTVWVGTKTGGTRLARLCAMRAGSTQCFGDDGALGNAVSALFEDHSGTLWICAQSGLWRWRPGPPRRESAEPRDVSALADSEEGRTLMARYGLGLMVLAGDKLQPYRIPEPIGSKRPLTEPNANKLLRDRNGGLWIGTVEHGLIHVYHGRTDVFTKADGLSGDIVLALFEDREGNVWVSTTGGLDRFREFAVATISSGQGLASDAVASVLADRDGSVWVGTHDGLTRWNDGRLTTFRKPDGLPGDEVQSLFQDHDGRFWVYAGHELAYLQGNRFIALPHTVPSEDVHSITGDDHGNLWLAGNTGLYHLRQGHLVENLPWPELGHTERAKVLVADVGGVWLSFWNEKAVSYFKDGQIRASYTAADGLGKGRIADLHLDRDGALWVATDEGGVSRIKDGRIATLTTGNGLPCEMIHWSIQDDDGALWLYTGCGLVRIAHTEMDAWIVDPQHRVVSTVLDAADGVRLRAISASSYSPTVARSTDGKLWFVAGDGVQIVDPRHLPYNEFPPPVHIEQIVADHTSYWQNLPGLATAAVRLPPRTRDVQIYYTALSLTAPENVHFKYKLEGQDRDWREVVADRDVQYSNLSPGHYRVRLIASNNNGVWNNQGDTLEFSVAPAYYQTNWFRALCAVFLLALLWIAYWLRARQLRHQFEMTLDARVCERTRIARDLHDTLLQSFQGLLLRFQTVSYLLPEDSEAKEKLDNAIGQAAEAITEGRDAVQGLRESTVQTNDLAKAISTLGEELRTNTGSHAPVFRVVVDGESRNLHPILRDEIYKIAAEALRNAFRHAQAQQVEVEIRYDAEQFRLRVRDDGKGFDPILLSQRNLGGHYGLPGMQERATLIGGKLTIWSELDAGTELQLRLPADVAYASAGKSSWFSRRFATRS